MTAMARNLSVLLAVSRPQTDEVCGMRRHHAVNVFRLHGQDWRYQCCLCNSEQFGSSRSWSGLCAGSGAMSEGL